MSIYDPANYPQGVQNPLGTRVHAWTGGPLDEGTRYHGAIWTRPQSEPLTATDIPRWAPFPTGYESLGGGCGCQGTVGADDMASTIPPLWKIVLAVGLAGAVVYGAIKIAGRKQEGAT